MQRSTAQKRSPFQIGLLFFLVFIVTAFHPARAQYGTLVMTSDRGDYIGGGASYNYSGNFFTVMANHDDYNPVGEINFLRFYYSKGSDNWTADFSTDKLGVPLTPGTYLGATRSPFEQGATPGLAVYGEGRGSNTLTGQFTITALSVDMTQTVNGGFWHPVTDFAGSFVQHYNGVAAALHGTMTYSAPEPSPLLIIGLGLSLLSGRLLAVRMRTRSGGSTAYPRTERDHGTERDHAPKDNLASMTSAGHRCGSLRQLC